MLVDKVGFSGSAERDRDFNFKADTSTATAAICRYYRAFASDSELFRVSETEPSCNAYLKKQCGKKWYWVPTEAGGVFLQLAMKTTFELGAKTAPPITYSLVILGADFQYDQDGWPIVPLYKAIGNGQLQQLWPSRYDSTGQLQPPPRNRTSGPFRYVLTFSRPIPSDEAQLTVTLPTGPIALNTEPLQTLPFKRDLWGQQQQAGVSDGTGVSVLYVFSNTYVSPDLLVNRPAEYYSADFPNAGPPTNPDMSRLELAVKRFRSVPQWKPDIAGN